MAMAVRQSGFSVGGLVAALCVPRIASLLGWRSALFAAAVLLAVAGLLCGLIPVWRAATQHRSPVSHALGTRTTNRNLIAATTAGGLLMVGQVAFLGFFVLDLVDRFQQTPVAAASALGLVHVAGGCSPLVWGRISDRWLGGRRTEWLQLLTLAAGAELAWLGFAEPQSINSTLFALVAGMTIQGWSGLYATLVTELVGPTHAGTATGLAVTVLFAVAMVTSPAFGAVVDLTASYRVAWATVSLSVLAAVPILHSIHEGGDPGRPAAS
jgi:MFS family permease